MSEFASGAEGRRVYLDAIDAALRKPRTSGKFQPRNLAEDVILRKLRQTDKLRRQLDRQIKREIRANRDWVPTEEIATTAKEIGADLDRQVARLAAIRKQHREAYGGLTEEQMDAVFMDQLRRVAPQLTDEQWHTLLAIKWGRDVADVVCGRSKE